MSVLDHAALASDAAHTVGELTTLLARLGARRQPVEPTRLGVDAALHGRAATLALARQVVDDVAGRSAPRVATIGDLEVRPVAVLTWSLARQPSITGSQSPIDVARAAPPGSPASDWEHVGALATRAHVQWTLAETTPTGPSGRAAVAEIAVLSLALTCTENALEAASRTLGDIPVAERLRGRHSFGLRVAAERTLQQLSAQELPTWSARPPLLSARLPVLPVQGVADLPRGLHRLNQMLRSDVTLSPGTIATLLSAQARMSLHLADRAARSDAGPFGSAPQLAGSLRQHAGTLAAAWGRNDSNLAILDPVDTRPLQQAGECLRAVRSAPGAAPLQALHRGAAMLFETARATSSCITRHVADGAWVEAFTPDDDTAARRWRPASEHAPPHVMTALSRLAAALPSSTPLESRHPWSPHMTGNQLSSTQRMATTTGPSRRR